VPTPNYQSLEKGLAVLEYTRRVGEATVATLSDQPGWTSSDASRYLAFLAERGWLQKVSPMGRPSYVLGRKALDLVPELRWK
jgi:DNA-binding IclR family transcriptional regulator